jgi:hypothetical protein
MTSRAKEALVRHMSPVVISGASAFAAEIAKKKPKC